MVVVLDRDGDIHVHAPFENNVLMTQFMNSILSESQHYNKKSKK